MQDMVRTHWITLEAECNWKVVQDNFCESYHIPTVHPALKYFLDDTYQNTQFDLYPRGHTRMLMVGGRPSPRVGENEEMTLRAFRDELAFWQLDVEDFRGRAGEIRAALQRQKRALGAKKGLDFSRYVDGQLTDHYHYTIFPNLAFSMKPDGCIFLRPNPHPVDPERCFFDVWYFTLFPDGVEEYPARSMADLVRKDDEVPHQRGRLGEICLGGGIDEDASVFVSQQRGLRSDAWRGAYLSNQERRVQYSHQVLDEYLDGIRPAPRREET
jgi:phenylpropionate dioxygenase-like ring-hydroxylating dioxygenase large terminal subunit